MISKKELLIKADISYGQLYRWKREGLIPDSWFIKQSVSTGQETFFDENLIIPRIEQIKSLKNKYQIEEMKTLFSDEKPKEYNFKDALLIDNIDPYFLKIYLKDRKNITITELSMLYLLTLYDDKLNSIDYLKEDYSNVQKDDSYFILLEKNNNYSFIITKKPFYIYGMNIIEIKYINDVVNKLAHII